MRKEVILPSLRIIIVDIVDTSICWLFTLEIVKPHLLAIRATHAGSIQFDSIAGQRRQQRSIAHRGCSGPLVFCFRRSADRRCSVVGVFCFNFGWKVVVVLENFGKMPENNSNSTANGSSSLEIAQSNQVRCFGKNFYLFKCFSTIKSLICFLS